MSEPLHTVIHSNQVQKLFNVVNTYVMLFVNVGCEGGELLKSYLSRKIFPLTLAVGSNKRINTVNLSLLLSLTFQEFLEVNAISISES